MRARLHQFPADAKLSLLAALLIAPLGVRADTVASLLGNFTVNQYCALQLAEQTADVRYAVVFGQLPALHELHLADANSDGVTTQAERDAYVERLAPGFASKLRLIVDGAIVPLRAIHWTSSLPTEQGGFSLRLDIEFLGVLTRPQALATRILRLTNQNYADQIGWDEITVQAPPSIAVFDTDAFSTSLTAGLTAAVRFLPPAGPLEERSIRLSFIHGPAPFGAKLLQPRPGTHASSAQATPQADGNAESAWLQRRTRSVIGLISAPQVAPQVAVLALLLALMLGAMHALSPGHGKTIVGAYLIGSRGTPRHALFLGVIVTITHTLGVFVLGLATLLASRFVVPQRLLPILSLISGLLVLGMGVFLLAQRWRTVQRHKHPGHAAHDHEPTRAHHHHEPHERHDHGHHEHGHAHGFDHHRDHAYAHAHEESVALTHSHGGSVHSHLPPGVDAGAVNWRSLLALGISGGLVPCPSAMVLLLAAVALNKTAYGLLLVVAFSVGLAATLTLVGLVFLYARNRFPRPASGARWPQLLPVASAAAITVIGAVLCVGAVQSMSVLH